MATPSSQPFRTGGEDARVLTDLALHNLAASFGPKFLGQTNPEVPAFLIFPTAVQGLAEEGELKVVVVTDLEQSPSSMVGETLLQRVRTTTR